MKLKRTYSYALWSAFYLTILSVAIATVSYYFIIEYLGILSVVFSAIVLFIISFFIIQYRAEHFIYRRFFEDRGVQEGSNITKENTTYIHTTYQDNIDNLSKSYIEQIEQMNPFYLVMV